MARLRPLASWIVLLLLASGCAGADRRAAVSAPTSAAPRFSGEQGRAAAVIADYQAATRAGDAKRLCERILFLDSLHATSRAGRLRRCAESGDLAQEIKGNQGAGRYGAVEGIRMKGSQAAAIVSVRDGVDRRTEPFYLKRHSGGWRVAARGLAPAHTDFRVLGRLDCRRVVAVADAQRAVRAVSAMAFLKAFLAPQLHRGRARASLVLVGVDFRNAARTFDHRTPAGKVLGRYIVEGTSPYSVSGHWFCATSKGSLP